MTVPYFWSSALLMVRYLTFSQYHTFPTKPYFWSSTFLLVLTFDINITFDSVPYFSCKHKFCPRTLPLVMYLHFGPGSHFGHKTLLLVQYLTFGPVPYFWSNTLLFTVPYYLSQHHRTRTHSRNTADSWHTFTISSS